MEQDKPKNFLILGYTLAIVVILVATVIFVDQYLKADVRHEYERKVLEAPTVQYRDLRASEDSHLGNYYWIDQSKGVVRLPKDRARELVLKEWATRPEGVVAPAAATPATPAPAAPPTTTPTGGTPTEPGTAPSGAKEPPGSAQPAPLAPGEVQKDHPAQGTDGTKKDPGPGKDRSK
jgi:hypothetical protein